MSSSYMNDSEIKHDQSISRLEKEKKGNMLSGNQQPPLMRSMDLARILQPYPIDRRFIYTFI